jgi:hypothetical protein
MEHQESCSSSSSPVMRQCRICHDEEDQSCSTMESPCACSGSLKVSISFSIWSSCSYSQFDSMANLLFAPLLCSAVRAPGMRAAVVRREGEHPLRDLPSGSQRSLVLIVLSRFSPPVFCCPTVSSHPRMAVSVLFDGVFLFLPTEFRAWLHRSSQETFRT